MIIKKERNKAWVICADLLQEDIQYLCRNETGRFYVCRVGQQNGSFFEKDVKEVSTEEARLFLSEAFLKASREISGVNGRVKDE